MIDVVVVVERVSHTVSVVHARVGMCVTVRSQALEDTDEPMTDRSRSRSALSLPGSAV